MDQYRWPLCPAQRGRISIPAQAPGSSWLPKRCLTWEGGFQGSKSFWQQTLCFQTGEDVPAFQRTECSGKPGWGGRLHPDVLCDREGTGPGCGHPQGGCYQQRGDQDDQDVAQGCKNAAPQGGLAGWPEASDPDSALTGPRRPGGLCAAHC